MKMPISFRYFVFAFAFCVACSKEADDTFKEKNVLGSWKLTTWTIGIAMDLNDDTVFNTNLLDEASCINNETLIFKSDGTFSSDRSYNPSVNISVIDGTTEAYIFAVACDVEGTIGLTGTYSQNGNSVSLLDTTAILSGNQLSMVFENVIAVYSEDFTEILETKDLTLIYQRE